MRVAIAFALIGLAVGHGEAASPAPPAETKILNGTSFRPDPQFKAILSSLVQDEVSVFAQGGDTALSKEVPRAEAKAVARLYSDNQVAGDQRYFEKRVLLSGTIGSINSGLGNVPYIVFRDTGFVGLQAHLPVEQAEEAAKLKKGQRLHLVCIGGGAIAGVPVFKDCQFANQFASAEGKKLEHEVAAFLQGKEVPETAALLAVYAESLAKTIDDASTCTKECMKLSNEKRASDPQGLGSVIRAMRDGGLKVPPAVEKKLRRQF